MKLTTSEVVKKPNNLSFSDYTLRCNQQTKKKWFWIPVYHSIWAAIGNRLTNRCGCSPYQLPVRLQEEIFFLPKLQRNHSLEINLLCIVSSWHPTLENWQQNTQARSSRCEQISKSSSCSLEQKNCVRAVVPPKLSSVRNFQRHFTVLNSTTPRVHERKPSSLLDGYKNI